MTPEVVGAFVTAAAALAGAVVTWRKVSSERRLFPFKAAEEALQAQERVVRNVLNDNRRLTKENEGLRQRIYDLEERIVEVETRLSDPPPHLA